MSVIIQIRRGADALRAEARVMLRLGGEKPAVNAPSLIRAAWREHQRRVTAQ